MKTKLCNLIHIFVCMCIVLQTSADVQNYRHDNVTGATTSIIEHI